MNLLAGFAVTSTINYFTNPDEVIRIKLAPPYLELACYPTVQYF